MSRRVSESVQHASFIAGAEDDTGNTVEAWGTAVTVGVYAFDPGGSVEPLVPGHDRVITEPTVYAPAGVVFGSRDRVTARGVVYEVVGVTAVWRHPNGLLPGNVINLRRVDG